MAKQVYASDEIAETGYLAYLDDTIQLVPLKPNSMEWIPGTTYVSYQCLYLNPLSSYAAFGGDSGYTYTVGEDFFETVHRNSGEKDLIDVQSWEWRPFPYTDEEWAALYVPGNSAMENIRALYDEILYQPLTDETFFLLADGDLWLVELKNNSEMGTYLWSIYSLTTKAAMGTAQWEYAPQLSSRSPVFQFQFDMEHTEISAACEAGRLVEFNFGEHKSGSGLIFPAGEPLSWSPADAEYRIAGATTIRFTIHNGDAPPYHGTIYIAPSGDTDDGRAYTASLVGTGLHLSQNTEWDGGIISLVSPYAE